MYINAESTCGIPENNILGQLYFSKKLKQKNKKQRKKEI